MPTTVYTRKGMLTFNAKHNTLNKTTKIKMTIEAYTSYVCTPSLMRCWYDVPKQP